MTLPLQCLDRLPAGLLETPATALQARLPGPTLIRIAGAREPALFVSVLLHGNETSGWNGVRRLLQECGELPRGLWLFIGNVAAAGAGLRTLPHQQDFNRIWRGASGAGGALAHALLAELAVRPPFAALDLHNNTGDNPHYSVLTDLTPDNFGLAALFADRAVHVREPETVLTRALAGRCPAVTLELGPADSIASDERAYRIVRETLALETLPRAGRSGLEVFQAVARIHPVGSTTIAFGDDPHASLVLPADTGRVNFREFPRGATFGIARRPVEQLLSVRDPGHNDVTARYLGRVGDRLTWRQSVIPAMYTTDLHAVRQDCLCYLMERLPLAP